MLKKIAVAATLTIALFAQTGAKSGKPAFDRPAVEAYLRHLLLWSAAVDVTMSEPVRAMTGYSQFQFRGTLGGKSQEATFFISDDGKSIFRGDVYNTGQSPFQPVIDQLKVDDQPFLGTPGAPVTVVEFADFQCPFCKQEADVIKTKLLGAFPKDMQLFFMDYPLEPIHPFARGAAILGRCIYRQNNASFWTFHDWMFEHQAEITPENLRDKVLEFARGDKNLDIPKLNACAVAPEPRAEVDRSEKLADALKVASTPTVFINGRPMVGAVALEDLKAVVDYELAYAKAQKKAADCCSVQLALPGMAPAKK